MSWKQTTVVGVAAGDGGPICTTMASAGVMAGVGAHQVWEVSEWKWLS